METNFSQLMISKTNDELLEYVDHRKKYNPDAIFEAIKQLQSRGIVFTEAEMEAIHSDIIKQQDISKKRIQASRPVFVKRAADFNFLKWYKNFVNNKFNKPAFIIAVVYVGIGTICVFGMYPGDLLHNEPFSSIGLFLTLPVSVISFCYRFGESFQNDVAVYIIQTIMLIPTFLIIRLVLNARYLNRKKEH